MNTWKVILATLVIFTTGIVTGGLLVSYADHARQKNRRLTPWEAVRPPVNARLPVAPNPRDASPRLPLLPNRPPRGLSLEFLEKLDAQIQLTPQQRERIEKIIAEGQQRNKDHWERVAPEWRREMAETQRRIREELTPAQRTRFEELMKQSRPAARRAEDTQPPAPRARSPRGAPGTALPPDPSSP